MADLGQAKADQQLLLAELLDVLAASWTFLTDTEQRLVTDYLSLSPAERARRERELEQVAVQVRARVDDAVGAQLGPTLHGAYEAGAFGMALGISAAPVFTSDDEQVLLAAAHETYRDLLAATRHMQQTTKERIRDLARAATLAKVTEGRTAVQAGRLFAAEVAGGGISAIVYRDGSRHGLAEYGGMLLRTKTAEVYQQAGMVQAERLGVTWLELLDNPSCGLTAHDDPVKANNLIVPLEVARQYPISHPNCVRATVARPDIRSQEQAVQGSPSTSELQNADQRFVEQQRQQMVTGRAQRRALQQRTARSRAGTLTPAAGAATSAAARRASARVARRRGGSS